MQLRIPLLISCLLVAFSVPAVAELDPSAVPWSSLTMRGRRLGISLRATASIETIPSDQAASQLLFRPDRLALSPRGAEVVLTTLRTLVLGRNSETRIWNEPSDGTALQRSQLDSGRNDRYRVHRFEPTGVFTVRRAPAAGQEALSHEHWETGRETTSLFPEWAGEGFEVSDPSTLFYFMAAAKLEEVGDLIQFPVFSQNQLILVDLKVTGRERTRVEFVRKSGGRSEEVRGREELIKLLIDGSHLGPGSEENDFEFLGIRGDVEILLHPELRVPIEVSGRVPRAGRVRIRLQEVELR